VSAQRRPGKRFQSERELAEQFWGYPYAAQQALAELENAGLLFTERTNGKFVTEDSELIKSVRGEYAKAVAENYLSSMEKLGISRNDAINYLKDLGGDTI